MKFSYEEQAQQSCITNTWDKNSIGAQRWDIATQEWKFCYIEIEIGMFVVNVSENVKLIDRSNYR